MRAPLRHFLGPLLAVLPSLGILAVLAILGIVGHLTEWKLSRVAGLWAAGQAEELTGPKESPRKPTAESGVVRFASPEGPARSGIQTAAVLRRPMSQAIVAPGAIDNNRTRLARLSTRAPGHVWKVYRHVGDPVQKGDLLGLIDAADVGRAKAELLQAVRLLRLRSEERQRQRQGGEAFPERLLREAEAAEVDARIRVFNAQQTLINLGLPVRAAEVIGLADEQLTGRLRFLGVPDSIRGTLDPATTTANLLPLLAPFDGLVIGSDMVEGEVVGSERPQFVVADVRRVWVTLDVRQEDVVRVRQGQRITFRPDGMPAVGAEGTVTWISTAVDAKTRTVQVRADVDNTGGQLRAHSFGTGRILIAEKPAAVAVPSQALQWDGSYPLVFVRRQDGLVFEPRQIRVGIRDPDYTEVLDGLRPGEVVATTGSHVLRSELFKGPTGAGD